MASPPRSPPASHSVADHVVDAAWAAFERLPQRSKPQVVHGRTNWVPCSAVVVSGLRRSAPLSPKGESTGAEADFDCLALATGAKCLSAAKVATAAGHVLHDWHAEILAIRIFNMVLIRECQRLAADPTTSSALIEQSAPSESGPPFQLRSGLQLYLYGSEAPCGDASMELVMAAQADPTPWTPRAGDDATLQGRGNFAELGVVRRKPARADSPITLSKSCSDKLALRQCTSLLSSVAALLIRPERIYLHALVLPASQVVAAAMLRAFGAGGRMQTLDGCDWGDGYAFRPFSILTTAREFAYSRRVVEGGVTNISAAWWSTGQETLINGVLQGRKATDARKASTVARVQMWRAVATVLDQLPDGTTARARLPATSYRGVKDTPALAARRRAKAAAIQTALGGWVPNAVDDFAV